eukprot:7017598-Pyramimonas_sp.AAC.1
MTPASISIFSSLAMASLPFSMLPNPSEIAFAVVADCILAISSTSSVFHFGMHVSIGKHETPSFNTDSAP